MTGALLLLSACDNGITDPVCDRCNEMRVLTDRAEYRNGSLVEFTITNRTSAELRYDWCSVHLVSRTSTDVPFQVRYLPSRRCGFDATIDDVIANMRIVAAGASLRDTLRVGGAALQGQYRVHMWLVDEMGLPETGNPIASNTFDVYPGAAAAVNQR